MKARTDSSSTSRAGSTSLTREALAKHEDLTAPSVTSHITTHTAGRPFGATALSSTSRPVGATALAPTMIELRAQPTQISTFSSAAAHSQD